MATTVNAADRRAHLLRTDVRSEMVKADLRKAEIGEFREQIGRAIERARLLRGWTLQELAREIKRDERQCARWIAGTERPQFDALFAVQSFRSPLVIALAEIAGGGVEVTTHISVRKTA